MLACSKCIHKKVCEFCKAMGFENVVRANDFDCKDFMSADIVKNIFERLYSHIKFDGHTLSVWENDLICIAKEYGVNLDCSCGERKEGK